MAALTFTRRSYFNAAQEHLSMAVRLREQGEYITAHFFAGIAVEAILRTLSVAGYLLTYHFKNASRQKSLYK